MLRIGYSGETDSRLAAAGLWWGGGREGLTANREGLFFWDENILEPHIGAVKHITVYTVNTTKMYILK